MVASCSFLTLPVALQEHLGRGLVARVPLRERDPILDVTCLWYDDKAALEAFFATPGGAGFKDRTVKVLLQREGSPVQVYGVMVGAGQFLQHYAGIRKSPNARLVFRPGKGFSRGCLEAVVATRNGAGIASGQEVCLNYGLSFQLSRDFTAIRDLEESPWKTVRGALDRMFQAQRTAVPGTPTTPPTTPVPGTPPTVPPLEKTFVVPRIPGFPVAPAIDKTFKPGPPLVAEEARTSAQGPSQSQGAGASNGTKRKVGEAPQDEEKNEAADQPKKKLKAGVSCRACCA